MPNMFNEEEVKNKLKKQLDQYLAKGFKLIHMEPTRTSIIKMVQSSPNKLQGIATATISVINRIDDSSRQANVEVHDGVKLSAANIFIGDIATISSTPIKENEMKTALASVVQQYLQEEIKSGRIDPNIINQQLEETKNNMSPEEQQDMNRQYQEIDDTAMQEGTTSMVMENTNGA